MSRVTALDVRVPSFTPTEDVRVPSFTPTDDRRVPSFIPTEDVRVPSFTLTEDAKARLKTTWIKSPRNHFLLIIMIKVNIECVFKCLLQCLEETESKYDEALVHSDGVTKHSVLVMWKILEMKNIYPFFFCQKFCITPFTDSLVQNATAWSWVYSQPNFVMLWSVWLSQYWIYLPYHRKSKSVRIRVFSQSKMILLLQNLINLMFS